MNRLTYLTYWTISIIFFFSFLFGVTFKAYGAPAIQVDLFYDAEEDVLRLDRYSTEPISIQEKGGIPMTSSDTDFRNPEGRYKVILYTDTKDTPIREFRIAPPSGTFTLPIPKPSSVTRFEIVNTITSQPVVEHNLETPSQCNTNNICEFENGENKFTCYSDCTQNGQNGQPVTFSEETQQELQKKNGVLRTEEGTVLLEENTNSGTDKETSSNTNPSSSNLWLLFGGLLLIGTAIGIWIYLTFFRDND